MFASDIQVVVFAAGRGSRMTHLIGNSVPKCLLRICGQPLIYYPLKSLANYGFQDVVVIIQEREDVHKEVERLGNSFGLRVEFLTAQEDDEDFGTLQSLRSFMKSNKLNKQKKDILLISCDTITDAPLMSLVNFHQTFSSGCSALFVKNYVPPLPTGVKLPGPKNKVKQERDIVGLRPGNNQLIFMASEADFEEDLNIPIEVLQASPHTKINTSLMDAHIYLLKREILERYVQSKDTADFLSVKGEFLPYLISQQLKNFSESDQPNTFLEPAKNVTLFGFMLPNNNAIRVNTVAAYSSASKSVEWLKQTFPEAGSRPKDTQISKSAKLIAAQLGDQCTVGEKVKMVNVISMDNVTFEEGCQVENSLISSNAIIGAKAIVKECLVGPGYQVPEGGRFVNENLTVMEETLFED